MARFARRWVLSGVIRSLLALSLAVPLTLTAQQDSAGLAGTVHSSVNGRPLAGVMVAVAGVKLFDVSDSTGAFALSGLPAGKQTVRILYRDDVLFERPFTLRVGRTLRLEVLLDVDAVELAPVVVEARSVRSERSLVGFYERRKYAFGRFYTAEELAQRGSQLLRSLLGESGVQVLCRRGRCIPVIPNAGQQCVLSLYLDGFPYPSDDLDFLRVDDLAGVEVYKRALEVPIEFQRPTRTGGCGAVVMWRR